MHGEIIPLFRNNETMTCLFTTGMDLSTINSYEEAILIRDRLLDNNQGSTILFPIGLLYTNVSFKNISKYMKYHLNYSLVQLYINDNITRSHLYVV